MSNVPLEKSGAERLLLLTHELEIAWRNGDLDAVEDLLTQRGETIESLANSEAVKIEVVAAATAKGNELIETWSQEKAALTEKAERQRKTRTARKAYKGEAPKKAA
ncbi:MAG: hypothetical protein KIT11_04805 [Fimbriimonadaceae bacterium]|nr:hypothetical protein [Fimbriimonadaceae bacterium]QYK56786.1 MAG: hypothetical protein KF733_04715 [Fimbriimonadaceae bacterium]